MAKPIISVVDPLENKQYFLIWDTFYEEPHSIGMDLLSLGVFLYETTNNLNGYLLSLNNILNTGSSLVEFDEFFPSDSAKLNVLNKNCINKKGYEDVNEKALKSLLDLNLDHQEFLEKVKDFIISNDLRYPQEFYCSYERKNRQLVELILTDKQLTEDIVQEFLPEVIKKPEFIEKLNSSFTQESLTFLLDPHALSSDQLIALFGSHGGENWISQFDSKSFSYKFWVACIEKNPKIILQLHEYLDDEKMVLLAIKNQLTNNEKDAIYRKISDRLKNKRNVIVESLKNTGMVFKYIPTEYKNDTEIIKTAMNSNYRVFDILDDQHANSQELQNLYSELKEKDQMLPF